MTEWQLYYRDMDGRVVRICLPLFFGALAAAGLWFLFLLVVHPPSVLAGAVLAAVVLTAVTWLFGWLTLRLATASWRSGRGSWWLRLSSNGFEVNDGIFRPRRYEWRQIGTFMLVAPAGQWGDAVDASDVTFADAFRQGGQAPTAVQVGYTLAHRRSRSIVREMFFNFRGRDGSLADGLVMGFWDRPAEDAVDLLNEWRRRYKAA
ncbi:hypothetical protein DVS77_33715 [Mycolicibacterium moriokaense]|nr:hypothetical protein DVS77_33715 [Mycolicibacterium moriokaense]